MLCEEDVDEGLSMKLDWPSVDNCQTGGMDTGVLYYSFYFCIFEIVYHELKK